MSVFSPGRDDTAGDGQFSIPDSFVTEYTAAGGSPGDVWYAYLNDQSLTQQPLIDVVSPETVDDTGSDDFSRVFQFRYTEGRVSIGSVTGEAGEPFLVSTNSTMTVSGTTN